MQPDDRRLRVRLRLRRDRVRRGVPRRGREPVPEPRHLRRWNVVPVRRQLNARLLQWGDVRFLRVGLGRRLVQRALPHRPRVPCRHRLRVPARLLGLRLRPVVPAQLRRQRLQQRRHVHGQRHGHALQVPQRALRRRLPDALHRRHLQGPRLLPPGVQQRRGLHLPGQHRGAVGGRAVRRVRGRLLGLRVQRGLRLRRPRQLQSQRRPLLLLQRRRAVTGPAPAAPPARQATQAPSASCTTSSRAAPQGPRLRRSERRAPAHPPSAAW